MSADRFEALTPARRLAVAVRLTRQLAERLKAAGSSGPDVEALVEASARAETGHPGPMPDTPTGASLDPMVSDVLRELVAGPGRDFPRLVASAWPARTPEEASAGVRTTMEILMAEPIESMTDAQAAVALRRMSPANQVRAAAVAVDRAAVFVIPVLLGSAKDDEARQRITRLGEDLDAVVQLVTTNPRELTGQQAATQGAQALAAWHRPRDWVEQTIKPGKEIVLTPDTEWASALRKVPLSRTAFVLGVRDLADAVDLLLQAAQARLPGDLAVEAAKQAMRAWKQLNPNCQGDPGCSSRFWVNWYGHLEDLEPAAEAAPVVDFAVALVEQPGFVRWAVLPARATGRTAGPARSALLDAFRAAARHLTRPARVRLTFASVPGLTGVAVRRALEQASAGLKHVRAVEVHEASTRQTGEALALLSSPPPSRPGGVKV